MRPALTLRLALACALALATQACTDPDECIWGGNVRTGRAGCAVPPRPRAVIDGDPSEWLSGVAPISRCATCPPFQIVAAHVAREPGALLVYLDAGRDPAMAEVDSFGIQLRSPYHEFDTSRSRVLTIRTWPGRSTATLGRFELPVGPEVAYGATGVEVRIPLELVPFPRGGWLFADRYDPDQNLILARTTPMLCWEAELRGPCQGYFDLTAGTP